MTALPATADPITTAWENFDRAALVLHDMYGMRVLADREQRMQQSTHVARLWSEFMAIYSKERTTVKREQVPA